MNIITLSALTARKRQLNQLCTAAVEQQVEQHKAENTQLRKRRRYLARQVLKHVSLGQHHSNRHWLHAVTMVFALWGFNDLVMPNQAVAAPNFGSENPLAGKDVDYKSTPVFEDIDGDGDLDAFIGWRDWLGNNYGVKYLRNTEVDADVPGTGFVLDNAANPLALVNSYDAKPAFADIDGDGDMDAFIGEYYGAIRYFRNTEIDGGSVVEGSGFVADDAGNPLALVNGAPYDYTGSSIAFADIDGDGDVDAFVGDAYGAIKYYRNTEFDADVLGTGFVADPTGNPLPSVNAGFPIPTFADIDADGDLDAFIGASDGSIKYYRNTEVDTDVPGTGLVADTAGNPLAGFDVGKNAAPTFADIDGDGDLDGFVGEREGTTQYFRNTQFDPHTPGIGLVVENPLSNVFVGRLSAPRFADVDGDGDLDAFVGEMMDGTIKYYRNTEIDTDVPGTGFITDTEGNPLAAVAFGYQDRPNSAFADLDGDGDLDAFIGKRNGTVVYYRNTNIDVDVPGTGLVADAAGNPFAAVDVGKRAAPSFVDIDGDGDLDVMFGENYGDVKYYRNTEIDADVPGTGFVADVAGNPFAAFALGKGIVFDFADLDGDGDVDAFVADTYGDFKYYRNTEVDADVPGTGFVADVAGNPLADFNVLNFAFPEFADLDGDGDFDAFLGSGDGRITHYQNYDPVPVTVDDNLDAIAGVTVTTVDVTANDRFKIEAAAGTFTITAFDATTVNGATVSNNGYNTFSYTALADFAGSDSFTYTLDDGAGNTAVGTVVVNVIPPIPSVDIQGEPASVNNTDAFAVTIEFSEDVTGFDVLANVTVVNGTVNSITPVDGNTYTVSITPDGNGDISIDIAGNVATGVITGANNAAAVQAVVSFDASGSGGSGGALNPWSLLLLPVLTLLRRKK